MAPPLTFRRYAGSIQVQIRDFPDLVAAVELPEALWLATACPTVGLICDARFLQLMDTDGNARVRVEEVRRAVEFTRRMLATTTGVDEGSDTLVLAHLSPDAAKVRDAAALLLDRLDHAGAPQITLAQVRQSDAVLREHAIHGDGIIAPSTLKDTSLRKVAEHVVASMPEKQNRAGQPGVDAVMVDAFRVKRAEALAHLEQRSTVFVWGEPSVARAERVRSLRPRIDEYFQLCRLVASQPEALAHLRLGAERLDALVGNQEALERALAALPIAEPDPAGVLHWTRLHRGPLFESLQALRTDLSLGDTLTEGQWQDIVTHANAIHAFQQRLETEPIHKLGPVLREITDADLERLSALSNADLKLRDEVNAMVDLERLVLYQRWLLTFANNFLCMPALYTLEEQTLFDRGRLVMGGRDFSMAVLVADRTAHAKLAEEGTMFIAYVNVQRRGSGEPVLDVAVPVTSGTSVGIVVGKRGIFYDHEGTEYDAVVTQVVRQPVSLWEAATLPFARIGRFIGSKIEALSQAGEKSLDASLESGYASAVRKDAATPSAGLIAGGGVAFAAVGSSLAFMVGQLQDLTLLDVINALLGIVAIVAAPSALLGWLKLRRRNLAVVLEGAGWALNDRLLLTRELGRLLTRRPARPKGSRLDRRDDVPSLLRRSVRHGAVEREPGAIITPLTVALLVVLALAWQYRGLVLTWLERWMDR